VLAQEGIQLVSGLVMRMTDAEAEATFRAVRWSATNGEPVSGHCGGLDAYEARRPNGSLRFRCKNKECAKDFTITSGTPFASHKGTTVHADESGNWNDLHARFEMKRINHQEAYSLNGACTNWAELFFSRLRRAEVGIHHHIAGAYLLRYAQEAAWREDHRRMSNGDQGSAVAGFAMALKPSLDFCGYKQRHIKAE
jgi:hypothetical protein